MSEDILIKTDFRDLTLFKRGKVRDIYDLESALLIVATDRISAFDVVLPNAIPNKGRILTQISSYWFKMTENIIPNHLISTQVRDYPEICHQYKRILDGRSMLVKKAEPVPVECVVRGYLAGSGFKEYQLEGSVSEVKLPPGLVEGSMLEEPIFTPATKAEEGHDENITLEMMEGIIGMDLTEKLRGISLKLYKRAQDIAEKRGIIIADTKFEFGLREGELFLIDELLTPDSSRFWPKEDYEPGRPQKSFDKQFVRDYLLSLDWDKRPPAPELPADVIKKTREKYHEALERLTGMRELRS